MKKKAKQFYNSFQCYSKTTLPVVWKNSKIYGEHFLWRLINSIYLKFYFHSYFNFKLVLHPIMSYIYIYIYIYPIQRIMSYMRFLNSFCSCESFLLCMCACVCMCVCVCACVCVCVYVCFYSIFDTLQITSQSGIPY